MSLIQMMVINYPEFSTESDSKLLSLALKKRNKPKQNASFFGIYSFGQISKIQQNLYWTVTYINSSLNPTVAKLYWIPNWHFCPGMGYFIICPERTKSSSLFLLKNFGYLKYTYTIGILASGTGDLSSFCLGG